MTGDLPLRLARAEALADAAYLLRLSRPIGAMGMTLRQHRVAGAPAGDASERVDPGDHVMLEGDGVAAVQALFRRWAAQRARALP